MNEIVARMILADIDALIAKLDALGDSSEGIILVAGSLAAARHIFRGAFPGSHKAVPPPRVNPAPGAAAAPAPRPGPRLARSRPAPRKRPPSRDLASEWSGPLPSLDGDIRGGDAGDFDVFEADPGQVCSCGARYADHAVDRNMDVLPDGRRAVVVCDGRTGRDRAYTFASDPNQ